MVKGWHLSKASAALSISACCFADGVGTSKRGGDATVPSRLKDTRILMMTLSLGLHRLFSGRLLIGRPQRGLYRL